MHCLASLSKYYCMRQQFYCKILALLPDVFSPSAGSLPWRSYSQGSWPGWSRSQTGSGSRLGTGPADTICNRVGKSKFKIEFSVLFLLGHINPSYRAFSCDVMLSSNMAASIATVINIHLSKHLFTLLYVTVSP